MAKITTADCKAAIVKHVTENAARLSREFVPPESMKPAELTKNWKRRGKRKEYGLTEREFDCTPYDDQLRGYTYDNGTEIVNVIVQGE